MLTHWQWLFQPSQRVVPAVKVLAPHSGKPGLSPKYVKAPYNIDKDFAG